MIETMMAYWWVALIVIAVVAIAVVAVRKFTSLPSGAQLLKVREWLLYAVSVAENELGSGTGKLKLRMVYDMFLTKFPYLAKAIPFEVFSFLVDEALDEFEAMLRGDDFPEEEDSE